ncbi:MAG: MFS transporter [Alphaproteobacteria bacterium]|nr:MFS transporter [Alphaproteobacteria bacterium]
MADTKGSPHAPEHTPTSDARVMALIGTGHFLSHFYMLCLPPLFPVLQAEFQVSYAMLGMVTALMAAVTAAGQTPVGFMVDRFGAKVFLVGGTLLMALTIAAMGLSPNFWLIVVLAVLSGIGNSVIHPADYAILAKSISPARMGRAFSMHTFTGNLGFAAGPPVIVLLMELVGWRTAMIIVGLLGLPVVMGILWQFNSLRDEAGDAAAKTRKGEAASAHPPVNARQVLLSRPILLFFLFMVLTAMSSGALQNFAIVALNKVHGTPLALGATALTVYLAGGAAGVLIGGEAADRSKHRLLIAVGSLVAAAATVLIIGLVPMPDLVLIVVLGISGACLGILRPARDLMLREITPPGAMGKVFGFASSGLPLGQAIAPMPFGWLIDIGRPELVFIISACTILGAILTVTGARAISLAQINAKAQPAE